MQFVSATVRYGKCASVDVTSKNGTPLEIYRNWESLATTASQINESAALILNRSSMWLELMQDYSICLWDGCWNAMLLGRK